jgi:uncharacterized protein (DUF1697 family)
MPRYAALLRAINVGGHTVRMDRLRTLFEELAFANVETFIASGNVIFETRSTRTDALEKRIERHLGESLGYSVETFIRTPEQLASVAAHSPFAEADLTNERNSLYVSFFQREPDSEAKRKLMALASPMNEFHVHEREMYWLVRGRMSDSGLTPKHFERALGLSSTSRNITTVRKLALKYCAS